ncbi:hypothetical protein UlMin_043640 [Ulmus minor]
MEDEKKKKRNKKKKNKQGNKAADEVGVVGGEIAAGDQNHESNGHQDDRGHVSEAVDSRIEEQDGGVDLSRHRANGSECSSLAETEKRQWLQRQATLEAIIKQLQTEKDLQQQKEATLEDAINELRKENNLHSRKEVIFENTIKQLRDDSSSYSKKEASLEMKIVQLQSERDSWIQKQAGMEEKVNQLVREISTWDLKEASLQERIKHLEKDKDSWIVKEDMIEERTENLNNDIARLQVQVVELEESRNNLLKENKQLVEHIDSLQLQIKDLKSISTTKSSDELKKLASEREDLNSQVEAACALVEKLVAENADLVEKVNELFVELDQRGGMVGRASTLIFDPMVGTSENARASGPVFETNTTVNISGQDLDSVEVAPVKKERNNIHYSETHAYNVIPKSSIYEESSEIVQIRLEENGVSRIPKSSISEESSEIVQIPLEENEVRDLESQAAENDEKDGIPLSDAPLIGAPFRLISFVSRYVSGADLVSKNTQ